ncbi:MAG: polysaccharide pyruvyl transferase family protein [Candidatus Peregrinibacteria bacterium]
MRVGIIGNYGATNVGDDAILSAVLKAHPDHECTVFSANPELTERQFNVPSVPLFPLGFRSFFKHGFFRSIRALRGQDVIIFGGGGLFQDDRLYACFLWAWQLAWVYWLKKPLFVYALGVGPLRTRLGRWLTRRALGQADVITVRDESSRQLLISLGLTEGEIHVTADPALLLKPHSLHVERTKGLVLVSLRPWLTHNAKTLEVFTEFLLKLKNERHTRFIFVCMQSIREHDRALLEPLARRVGGELWAPTNFAELLAKLQQAEFAIGMRFHFLIAALLADTPVLPIAYSPKVHALFAGTSLESYLLSVEELSTESLWDLWKRLSVDYNNVKVYERKRAEALKEMAEQNITLFHRFIQDLLTEVH